MWNKFVFVFLTGFFFSGNADHWGYPDLESTDEPKEHKWGGMCDNGKRQSPINLLTSAAFRGVFPDFKFENYDQLLQGAVIRNTGHSVQINVPKNQEYLVSGGGLPGTFRLEQMHWHWWSEHTINGRRYPLELHLVHRDQTYPNISMAVGQKRGVAVFAVLFHVTDEENLPLTNVLNHLDPIEEKVGGETGLVKDIKPEEFLPKRLNNYFRYDGSLTTPSCDESVVWTVFIDSVAVSLDQVEKFTEIKDAEGKFLKNNFRSIQPAFNRAVTLVSDTEMVTFQEINTNNSPKTLLSFGVLGITMMVLRLL